MGISIFDLGIVVVYMIAMLIMGYFLGKDNKTNEDYYVAGRKMGWLPVGLSVAATTLSCNGFIGSPGWSYTAGMTVFMAQITIPIALMLSLAVFVPIFYSLKVTSVYEYVELRVGPKTRVLSVCGFLLNSLIQASSMVYIPALIVQRFTGADLNLVVIITVIIALSYTLLGGIKAVIWTDALQTLVIWGGLIAAIIYVFVHYDLTFFDTIATARDAGLMNAVNTSWSASLTNPNALWVCLIGGFFVWFKYFAFDQAQVQRMLTAKSEKQLKNSFVLSAVICNAVFFLLVLLGPILAVAFDGMAFDSQNDVMIYLISELPIGLAGIVLAAAFAAAMSSIDSLLNSMSAVYEKDLHGKIFRNKTIDTTSLKTSMMISAVWGILILVVTILAFSGTTSSILNSVGSYISYISGPTTGLFLLCFFYEKANDRGVCFGSLIGFAGILAFGLNSGLTWKWNPMVGTVMTIVAGIICSNIFSKDALPENALEYSVKGYTAKVKAQHAKGDKSMLLPFTFDKYSWILIAIFFAQFIILIPFT